MELKSIEVDRLDSSFKYERCHQDVRFVEIIHAIRNIAVLQAKEGKIKIEYPNALFAEVFVNSIRAHGRVWETGLTGKFFLKRRDLSKMISYAPLGIKKAKIGKLPFLPHRIKGVKGYTQNRPIKAHS